MARVALTVFLMGPWGCAHQSPYPSEAIRAQFNTIGVVSVQDAPEVHFYLPAKGPISGAGRGAAIGARTGLGACAWLGEPPHDSAGLMLCLAIGLALTPPGAVIGAVSGAMTALPAATVEKAEAILRQKLTEAKVQDIVRNAVVREARRQTRYTFIVDYVPIFQLTPQTEVAAGEGPRVRDERTTYREWTDSNAETLLEVRVESLTLDGLQDMDPTLQLEMTVRTRLLRARDHVELYNSLWTYSGAKRRLAEWAVNEAKPFRSEVERCLSSLANLMAEALFVMYPLEYHWR